MTDSRVLILGGTAEARALASTLVGAGVAVTSSLAGRVSDPALPVGEVRSGGFGGVGGLVDYLRSGRISTVVDATHPYAAIMSSHAVSACAAAGIPLLRLARPGWAAPLGATWHWAADHDTAAAMAGDLADRVFLTTGRQTLPAYLPLAGRFVLVRVVEPVAFALPAPWAVVHDRGPYELLAERDLMTRHRIGVLVTKDSGGSYTYAKLSAAAELEIPVVLVRRPPAALDVDQVSGVSQASEWVRALLGGP